MLTRCFSFSLDIRHDYCCYAAIRTIRDDGLPSATLCFRHFMLTASLICFDMAIALLLLLITLMLCAACAMITSYYAAIAAFAMPPQQE